MPESPFPFQSVGDLLLARSEDDNTALLFEDRRWTWREFVAEAQARAAKLVAVRGDGPWHVGVLMDNEPEYLFLIAGAALCGATVVGINPTRRGAELAADIRGTDVGVLLAGSGSDEVLAGVDLDGIRVIRTESPEYAALASDQSFSVPPGMEHVLLLLFTSGSTGAPKAVVCSSFRLAVIGQLNVHQLTSDDVAYSAMPLFHGNALMAAWAPILVGGGAFAIRRRFSASGFLPDVQRFGATFFNYVGRSLSYVLAQPPVAGESDNRLRLGFGTEASTRDRREFERRFGCKVVESYGSSEGVCTVMRADDTPDGALGKPAEGMGLEICDPLGNPCVVAEFDADGQFLNAAEATGEIVVRGGRLRFEGYYKNPAATEEKLRGDDYWTGDLAYQDADGNYWFAGRTADWLRVDSENFASAPIERILARFPDVITAVVYAVPDATTGDRVMAAILMDEGHSLDIAAFDAFLRAEPDLGTKWRPTFVRQVRALPSTATRKVDKQVLRREAWLGDDPTWEWDGTSYLPLTAERTRGIREDFAHHGRTPLHP